MHQFLRSTYIFIKNYLNTFIPFLVRHKMFNLLSLLLIFNLSRIKKILPKNKSKYKVIVLSKSAGIDDLEESQKKYNKKILYFHCPRVFFKNIFWEIFRGITKVPGDLNYETKNKKIIKLKIQYRLFLVNLLLSLKQKLNIDAFIGFNFNYFAERELHSACTKLKIPFIILFKESILTELEKKFKIYAYKKKNQKYYGYKIAVYSNLAKKFLVDSNIINKNNIEVVGCSRLTIAYSYQKISPKNQIIYYAIESNRGLPNNLIKSHSKVFFKNLKGYKKYDKTFNWNKLNIKTIKILKRFAIDNPKIPIIIKKKIGDNSNNQILRNLPKNIKIYDKTTGHKFLKNSKIIIAWNTTAILEAIAANRFILLPNYYNKKKNLESAVLKLKLKEENYGLSEKDFIKKLRLFINKKYNKDKINNNRKSLKYYLGNEKNDARLRLNNFIINNMKI